MNGCLETQRLKIEDTISVKYNLGICELCSVISEITGTQLLFYLLSLNFNVLLQIHLFLQIISTTHPTHQGSIQTQYCQGPVAGTSGKA